MGPKPAKAPPHCTKCTTAHPSMASVPITILLYNGPLLCGFRVAIKGLSKRSRSNLMHQTQIAYIGFGLTAVAAAAEV